LPERGPPARGLTINGEEFLIMKESDILGVIEAKVVAKKAA